MIKARKDAINQAFFVRANPDKNKTVGNHFDTEAARNHQRTPTDGNFQAGFCDMGPGRGFNRYHLLEGTMIRLLDVAGAILYIVGGLIMSLAAECWRSVDRRRGEHPECKRPQMTLLLNPNEWFCERTAYISSSSSPLLSVQGEACEQSPRHRNRRGRNAN